jgi:8-hydroxy-5-deazaflavin:NADPH oxidoreductase
MKIGILGTGGVGKAIAAKLVKLEHEVMIGTRDVRKTLESRAAGSFHEFIEHNPKIKLGTFEQAATFGEMVMNVARGAVSLDVMQAAGEKNLEGKILIDIANPLDFSHGLPPVLIPELSNTTSLGEELQKRLPKTKVVKTLNTMWNGLMINPGMIANGDHVNYICGNDAEAKEKVKEFLYQFGWKKEWLIDIGDITGARATEATLPIWLRVYGAKKSGAFNFSIVQ